MTTSTFPRQAWTTNRYVRAIISHHRVFFGMNIVFFSLFHAVPLFYGWFVKLIFDALEQQQGAQIWLFVLAYLSANYLRVALLWVGDWFFSSLWYKTKLFLQRNMLDYLLNARGSRIIRETSGEAVSRFRDDVDEVIFLLESYIDVFGIMIFSSVALVIMFNISPKITLLMVVPLLVILAVTRAFVPTIRRFRERSRAATEGVTGFIGELFTAVQSVRVAGKEQSMLQHFADLNETRRQAALKDTLLVQLLQGINQNMVNISIGVVLLLASSMMGEGGALSVGSFALFLAYLPRLTQAMAFVGDMMAVHKRAGVSFERMNHLLTDAEASQLVHDVPLLYHPDRKAYPEKLQQRPQAYSPVLASYDALSTPELFQHLRVEKLSYQHPSGKGIHDISFEVQAGQFVVITGRVGAGKSTLVKSLLGLLPQDNGDVYWNDSIVHDPASFFTPPRSAYTAQNPRLVSDSLQQNIVLGQKADALEQSIRLAVMKHDVARLEKGLHTRVGTRGVKLSGGQVQRSAAARMFMQRAQLLVFDDMSSALDVHTEQQLWEGIFTEAENAADVTCLVISHRQAALQRADLILLMDGGRIVDRGTLEGLLERSEAMRSLWDGSQQ